MIFARSPLLVAAAVLLFRTPSDGSIANVAQHDPVLEVQAEDASSKKPTGYGHRAAASALRNTASTSGKAIESWKLLKEHHPLYAPYADTMIQLHETTTKSALETEALHNDKSKARPLVTKSITEARSNTELAEQSMLHATQLFLLSADAKKQAAPKLAAQKQAAQKQAAQDLAARKQAAQKQAVEKQATEQSKPQSSKVTKRPRGRPKRVPSDAAKRNVA